MLNIFMVDHILSFKQVILKLPEGESTVINKPIVKLD